MLAGDLGKSNRSLALTSSDAVGEDEKAKNSL